MLTMAQIRDRSKTVTRRDGWKILKAGDLLCAVEKSQGLGKGGKLTRIATIRVVNVRREPLKRMAADPAYGKREAVLEGFPNMDGPEFCNFFMDSHKGVTPSTEITRIEFEYVDGVPA